MDRACFVQRSGILFIVAKCWSESSEIVRQRIGVVLGALMQMGVQWCQQLRVRLIVHKMNIYGLRCGNGGGDDSR